MVKTLPICDTLSHGLQSMIHDAVADACNMLNDLAGDDPAAEGRCLTIFNVKEQARVALQHALDPDNGSIPLSSAVTNAINEFVDARVGMGIVY